MAYRNHLLGVISFCLIVACQPERGLEMSEDGSSEYASFKGAGPTHVLTFENTNLKPKDMIVAFDDVAHHVEVCDKPDYHICIESPFELYVPRKIGAHNFKNSQGDNIEVAVSIHKEEADISRICELEKFWVTVRNDTSKYTGNFHFNKADGLVALFETLRLDDEKYEPILGYSLDEGSVFEMAEFCGKGSD